ncbi:pyrroline-5-carboxylate reductase [Marinihelvus fidelis]|uniref:Pyrroline-5-carboxylate reductase n=1 Tax=Marinihelvus fidelis TaxID=2613842 RepID=A0A5N0T3A8_9GAMM|nr:pyrroline-5-carboxylate reductase [Marinihelvus fidelis]KAA9129555.1 pyrroline-5-carboxylate reductase [Marinihelvus fidelis]
MRMTFIGGGNMATALIAGLASENGPFEELRVADPSNDARERLAADYGVQTFADAAEAIDGVDVIVLAVKPQVMPLVFETLRGKVAPGTLVISVAAGIRAGAIVDALGVSAVVRAMPNTPALLGAGVTGLYASPGCSDEQRETARSLLAMAGATVSVDDEGLIDVVTAVSGSGPAYFFLLTEALRDAGQALGLDAETATTLATHTAHGAGVMALQGGADVSELRRRVTSPGGTTQAALETLGAGGFGELVAAAVDAATRRGRELSGGGDPA